MKFAIFCLLRLVVATLPDMEGPAPSRALPPLAHDLQKPSAGADPSSAKQKAAVDVKAEEQKKDESNRARFGRFANLLSMLCDPAKFVGINEERATALTGFKLKALPDLSNGYMRLYQTLQFDDMWMFRNHSKAPLRTAGLGESVFLDGVELRLPGPLSTLKRKQVILILKEETRFTVADFRDFFKCDPTTPRIPQHPPSPDMLTNVHCFRRGKLNIGVICDSGAGNCRAIVINNDEENQR